ncbi:MAG: hypothetical protein IJ493_08865 [Clostridia bacterium]|nr:hypothetical protein [Clostridia bacterium]
MAYFTKNGGAYIQSLIAASVADGSRQITVSGNYEIEQTVLIPSDFTLILENCHLTMADNTFCNMFTNESCRTEKGRTIEGCDRNIIIEGHGRVILDGGNYNGLCEWNSLKDGRPHISVNNMLLFTNVENFRISGLHIRHQRWWAMNFIFCRHGKIRDIDFLSDATTVNPDGSRTTGISWSNYVGVYIKNADGIDLRVGCHDIIIENITGFTEDDSIALTALNGKVESIYGVEGLSTDLHNVIIRNVNTASFCSMVRLLNQGGTKLYNILIDGVVDASMGSPYMDRGGSSVRVGDQHVYRERHSTREETFNITIRNVASRANAAVDLAGSITNLTLDNIRGFDGCNCLVSNHATLY